MQPSRLQVLPSSRAIREGLRATSQSDGFISPAITMGEFLERVVVVDGAARIDMDRRTLLLLEAAHFEAFGALQIERNFYAFTQNSHYFFRFFEELAAEEVSIDALSSHDTYGEYEEHLAILVELRRRYGDLCVVAGLVDPLFIPEHFEINASFLKRYDAIEVHVEGYLTNFELRLLRLCSELTCIELLFEVSPYHQKMQEKFEALGTQCHVLEAYKFDLSSKSLLSKASIDRLDPSRITCKGFSERLMQIAFVQVELQKMVDAGIAPERIAVIVPDERFAMQLRRFDTEGNFNFAMGSSLSETPFGQEIAACIAYLDNSSIENRARVERLDGGLLELMRARYADVYDANYFAEAVKSCAVRHEVAAEAVGMMLYRFERLGAMMNTLSMRQVWQLWTQHLTQERIDDIGGGKITVMGLLESRACSFEGVIIVDFNEGFVPKPSEKDLFITSAIRAHAGLPTLHDRESLQKHYYYQLLRRSTMASICWVEGAERTASRFLMQLGLHADKAVNEAAYAALLFGSNPQTPAPDVPIEGVYDFKAHTLSASGLRSFLTCKRQFYYRYIRKLEAHEIPRELPQEWEIGTKLHAILQELYAHKRFYADTSEIKNALYRIIAGALDENPLVRYQLLLWQRRLEAFCVTEAARFEAGCRIETTETVLHTRIAEIRLEGRIDRIDVHPDGYEVLDYKSGSYVLESEKSLESATDFQLNFYELLVAEHYGIQPTCGYYDLEKGAVVYEPLLAPKRALLLEHLERLAGQTQWNFGRCESSAPCRYCTYATLCGRL